MFHVKRPCESNAFARTHFSLASYAFGAPLSLPSRKVCIFDPIFFARAKKTVSSRQKKSGKGTLSMGPFANPHSRPKGDCDPLLEYLWGLLTS